MNISAREMFVFFLMAFWTSTAQSAPILYDWAFYVNGVMYTALDSYSPPDSGQLPECFDYSGFDWDTGLGTILISCNPDTASNYNVISFFDHEIDEGLGAFDNEFGAYMGNPDDGMTWEIDEPGYVFGDIYSNISDGTLDDTDTVPIGLEDDVSLAIGWDFTLSEGEIAVIELILGNQVPASVFYLSQTDSSSDYSIYFSSNLEILESAAPIPEPATMLLFGIGLVGLVSIRKRLPQ